MHAWIHHHRLYGTCCCLLLFYGCPAHCPPSPPTAWTNPCSRVRELEEELRLMDQNMKSMMCGEEEVLTVQTPPRSNSDLLPSARLTCSLSTPLSVFCLTLLPSMTSSMSFKQYLKNESGDILYCFSCQQIAWKTKSNSELIQGHMLVIRFTVLLSNPVRVVCPPLTNRVMNNSSGSVPNNKSKLESNRGCCGYVALNTSVIDVQLSCLFRRMSTVIQNVDDIGFFYQKNIQQRWQKFFSPEYCLQDFISGRVQVQQSVPIKRMAACYSLAYCCEHTVVIAKWPRSLYQHFYQHLTSLKSEKSIRGHG